MNHKDLNWMEVNLQYIKDNSNDKTVKAIIDRMLEMVREHLSYYGKEEQKK